MRDTFQIVQAGFRKGRGTRNHIANIIEKSKGIAEKHLLLLHDNTKAFHCMDHNKLWKILKEMEIPDHLTCFLRNMHADQEATVRIGHGTTDWFKIGKGGQQGCILSSCLFNFYTEYIIWKDRLDESQAGFNTAGRNIDNLRHGDNTALMVEIEEQLKSFLMRVKEKSEKVGFKLNIKKTKIMASGLITSQQIDGGKVEQWQIFYFLGLPKSHYGWWVQPWN